MNLQKKQEIENKVAIITWHTHNNYGGVLQAFALKEAIRRLGVNKIDFVQYVPKIKEVTLFQKLNYKSIKYKLKTYNADIKKGVQEKNKLFDEFRKKYFSCTNICNTKTDLYELNEQYDKFISGSDQIWAPTVFDENYFLEFVTNDSKKIAYAPSIGVNDIENIAVKNKMAELIKKYNCLSIREEKGKEIIKNLCNIDAPVVLDPTLLLNKKDWNSLFNLQEYNEKNYILIYCLGSNRKAKKIAKYMAKKLDKKIIMIPNNLEDFLDKNTYNPSVVEFLKLIYNASMVITDSFHGTIFSINFNVPFVVLKRFKDNTNSQNSRIYNILKLVNSENRLYNNNNDYFIKNLSINFEDINNLLEVKRNESISFLAEVLKKENIETKNEKITNYCTGCGMCVVACPNNCIEIKLNENGFWEYSIDKEKCINCNMCKKICAQLHNERKNISDMKLYSAYSTNEDILKKSSSGGIAYEISKFAIENQYDVIGCTYDYNTHKAKHIKINTLEDINYLTGSKYIQSYTKDAFSQICKMKKGVIIGTPCQIASIDNYLKINNTRDNFILVDLICHGVPSYLLWNKFIEKNEKIEKINFRDKSSGWRRKDFIINDKKIKEEKSFFYDFFNLENIYNLSCYECNYRSSSCADIRLGDYWGKKFEKNNTGMSMVIGCTKNGNELIEKLVENQRIIAKVENVVDYFSSQQTQNHVKPDYYDNLMDDFKKNNYTLAKLSKKYCKKIKFEKKVSRIIYNLLMKCEGVLHGKK